MRSVLILTWILLTVQAGWSFTPTSGYEKTQIEGFSVLINRQLKEKSPDLTEKAIKELTCQLMQINRKVSPEVLVYLRQTTIWMELDNSNGMCYHPNRQWLIEHDYNPEKSNSIEIGNARHFVEWSKQQPWMVMHEMAHYYHHNVLGYQHPGIKKAYQKAVEDGTYEKVLHINGQTVRAYALNNDKEYFAEASEAFFGTNDMYPFVRSELKEHDPDLYALLEDLWTHPPSKSQPDTPIEKNTDDD